MTFLEWTFLLGAVAVIGPVAAHLLSKPRFRRVPFTMLRFLRSGRRESHARRHIRDLLILLLRCAIIVVIAMLFAQPLFRVAPKPQPHKSLHYLAVDDSVSMAYHDGDTTLLSRAIEASVEYVSGLSEASVCDIRTLASRRTFEGLGKTEAIASLRQLTPAPKNADVEEYLSALRQARRAMSPGDSIRAAVFSDFAPDVLAQFDHIREPARVEAVHCAAARATHPVNNAAIVNARVADGEPPAIDVTVFNCDAKPQSRTVTAQGSGMDSSSVQVDLAPHERQVRRLPLHLRSEACAAVTLALSGKDGLAEDDTYRVAVCPPSSTPVHVLLIGGSDETFLFQTAVRALSKQGYELRNATEDRVTSSDFAWADVIVAAGPPANPICGPSYFESFFSKGGRLICFATRAGASDNSRLLMQRGSLPALPEKWTQSTSRLEATPITAEFSGFDRAVAQSLVNCRLDRIALKGYWTCRTNPQSQCLWRLAGGTGFMYGKAVGPGLSVFVNTSIDSSLGLLAKSQAWVPFCQYLLGPSGQIRGYHFSTIETPILSLPRVRPPAQVRVQNCDGSTLTVRPQGDVLRLPAPTGLGWIKTLDSPQLSAGINLPDSETEIVVPSDQSVASAIKRAFIIEDHHEQDGSYAEAKMGQKPVWRAFAWAALLMILLEPALANRFKR